MNTYTRKSFQLGLFAASAVIVGSANAALVYVDAAGGATGNTVNASNLSATDWTVLQTAGSTNTDNLWGERTTGPATNAFGTVFEAISTTEATPSIRTAVPNLLPNTTYGGLRLYQVGSGRSVMISFDNTTFVEIFAGDGVEVDNSNGGLGVPATQGGDKRYYNDLPDATTDALGNLNIYIRQGSVRSDYDGIAFESVPVPEPASSILSLFGAALLLRRHR